MTRAGVALLAILGLFLAAAGALVALAVGIPALGLNPYGRNPLSMTIAGLVTAAVLYLVGAALLVSATRWMRDHGFAAARRGALAVIGGMVLLFGTLMAVKGFWISIAMFLVAVIAMLAPAAIGLRPKT